MSRFNFKKLIEKYTKTLPQIEVIEGGYTDYDNGGVWVEGEITYLNFEGAVLPLGEDMIIDNGAYTTDDKKLYTYEDITTNQIIKHKDRKYTTMGYAGYEDFDEGLKIFILKAGGKDD